MGPSQVPVARALRNSTARNTPSRCHEAVGAFRRGLEPARDGSGLSVAQGGGGRQERRGVSFGQNYGNSGQGAGVGPRLTRNLLRRHSPSACSRRAARWTDSGRRPSSRASARPLRRSLGGRVDVVDLFRTGVGRPGSIPNASKDWSARWGWREQCLRRSAPFPGHLKGPRVDGPCLTRWWSFGTTGLQHLLVRLNPVASRCRSRFERRRKP